MSAELYPNQLDPFSIVKMNVEHAYFIFVWSADQT